MSTRKIKNAVNNTTGELIYFKGHAQATYMSDGSTVEDAIKNIKPDLSDYVKSEELEGYAKTSDIPSLEGYAKTEDIPSLDGYAKTTDIPSLDGYVQSSQLPDFNEFAKTSDIPSTEGLATEDFVTSQGYLTEIPSEYITNTELNSKGYATKTELNSLDFDNINNTPFTNDENGELNIVDEQGNIGMKLDGECLYVKDVVAGEHTLSEKVDKTYVDEAIAQIVDGAPETLDILNELSAALKDNADIVDVLNQSISSKQDVIPDLETIKQGAAKGATALQSYTEQYKGTVTGVKINGATKNPSNGVVDLGTVITSHQDISGKQDKLVSGNNIKTINGTSILGEGDLSIQSTNIVTLNIGSLNTENSSIAVNLTEDQLQILRLEDAVIKITFMYIGTPHVCTMFHTINGVTHIYSGIAYMVKNSVGYDTTKRYVYGQFKHTSNTITFTIGDIIVTESDIKTINGQSLVGSGDITIEGGGDYLPLTGGTITGDLTLTGGNAGMGNFYAYTVSSHEAYSNLYYLNSNGGHAITMGDNKVEIINALEITKASIDWSGDGTKFLSDDGTYKTIGGGGNSDVNVEYATKVYVDTLVGDINSVLESIINGSETNEVVVNIVEQYLASPVPKDIIYDVICVLSKPLDVKQTATLYYLDGDNQPQTLSLIVEAGQTEFVFEQVMINYIEPDMYSVVIGEIEEEDANGIKVTLRSNFKFKYVYS